MKKALIGVAGVLVLGLGVLAGAYRWAGRDEAPPEDADFAAERAEVAEAENAYTYFLQATNGTVAPTNMDLLAEYRMGKPVDEEAVRAVVEQNAESLAWIRRGAECAICQTPPAERIETLVPYIQPWLTLSRVLEARARQARLAGRPEAAVADVQVALRFGDLIQRDATCLINYLVGLAIFSSAAEAAQEVARDPATPPEALARLAETLRKTGRFERGLRLALQAEYRMGCHVVDDLRRRQSPEALADILGMDGETWVKILQRAHHPAYSFKPHQTKRRLGEFYRRVIADIPKIYADLPPEKAEEEPVQMLTFLMPNAIGRLLLDLLEPAIGRILETRCKLEAMASGTGLVVACQRFARERGRWPAELSELVPDYLEAVPRDPYDGAGFRYSAEKGLAWAVGRNLTDEGGSTRLLAGAETGGQPNRDRTKAEDFVFEVRAATKAAE
jgi:hypothetical protein